MVVCSLLDLLDIDATGAQDGHSILILAEDFGPGPGAVFGWLIADRKAQRLVYRPRNLFKPTDMAVLPNGDVLVLERRYTPISGPGAIPK